MHNSRDNGMELVHLLPSIIRICLAIIGFEERNVNFLLIAPQGPFVLGGVFG